MIPRTGGDRPARALAGKRLLRPLQAMLLGLLAPFPTVMAQGPTEGNQVRRDTFLTAPPVCTDLDGALLPLVNLHDAYRLHGGSMLLGSVRDLDRLGEGMATGDYTGDGVADLAIGVPAGPIFSGPRAGLLYPFQGSAGGPTQGRMLVRGEDDAGGTLVPGDDFGAAIAIGDFNDDGLDDVAVGAPGKVPSGTAHAGVVFVFHGNGEFMSGQGSFAQEQAGGVSAEGDGFGRALASADFNGDGFEDLAIGVPAKTVAAQAMAGEVVIFPGSGDGLVAGSILTETAFGQAPQDGDRFGAALVTGDFNGDGRMDLVVGIPGKKVGNSDGAGTVGILYGSAAGLVAGPRLAQEQAFQASQADDGFGAALAAGSLDGDNRDDLLIGAAGEDRVGALDAGMACPFLGGAGTFLPRPCVFEESAGVPAEALGRFGSSVAIGDLDDDGLDDAAVGAPGSALGGASGAGALFVFASTPVDLQARHTLLLQDAGGASDAGDLFGARSAIADFNGDGSADIAVAATFDAPPDEPRGGTLSIFPGLSALPRLSSGPAIGAVTGSSIRIWGRADRAAALGVEYKPAGTPWPGAIVGPAALTTTTDFTGTIPLNGLSPDTAYEYRLLLDGVAQPGSEASFRTLETPGRGRALRFMVGADFEFGFDPYAILQAVEARQPDFALLVGDQIYADEPARVDWSVAGYARRYRENWGEAFLAPFLSRIPSFAIWDDHEIEDNWQFGTSVPYPYARQAYDLYQAARNPLPRLAGEISFSFEAGDAAFYVLDVRSHRSSNSDPDNASKTMLGAALKADLKAWLVTTPARFKFLVSPVMWADHGTTGNDSWFGFQTERQEILDFIRAEGICGVVLLSGDQHWSAVMRLDQAAPYSLYELSPTPLGNTTRTKTAHTGPDILFADDASKVYGFVIADSTVEPARVTLEIYDDSDTRIFQRVLLWSDLCPDSDGDTFRDDVDCAPANASLWARPAEVTLTFQQNATTLQWTPSTSAGGATAPVYDLLVSPSRSDFSAATAACLLSNTTALATSDGVTPPSGQARYYLVRAENLCGGTLAIGSDGTELLGRNCP